MSENGYWPEPRELDEKGRCCGQKPIVYKSRHSTSTGPHRFCPRCDRAYDLEENWQINNWAWKQDESGVFRSQLKAPTEGKSIA